jgi:hypothetical protein
MGLLVLDLFGPQGAIGSEFPIEISLEPSSINRRKDC